MKPKIMSWATLQKIGLVGLSAWLVIVLRCAYERYFHWQWYIEWEKSFPKFPEHPIIREALTGPMLIALIGFLATSIFWLPVMWIYPKLRVGVCDWRFLIYILFACFAEGGIIVFIYFSLLGLWDAPIFHILSPYMPYGGK